MESNLELLKHIYHEDIYIFDEPEKEVVQDDQAPKELADSVADDLPKVEEQLPVQFFGGNASGILILVEDPSTELLNQSDLDFLMKVVESGLRFSKNDFALVNTSRFPVSQVLEEVPYEYILSFGVSLPESFGNFPAYQIADIDGSYVLLADSLRVISRDQDKKKLLWGSLKSMFNIS